MCVVFRNQTIITENKRLPTTVRPYTLNLNDFAKKENHMDIITNIVRIYILLKHP